MTVTASDLTNAPSRSPLLAALGIAAPCVLTAVGTFWAVNDKASDKSVSDWLVSVGIIAVAAALVYGLVVRTAGTGNPGRRALVLGIVGTLSIAVFWAGLPVVLASAAVACAYVEKDRSGTFGNGSKAALVLASLTTAAAASLAVFG